MVTKEDEKIMESLSDRSRRERSERRRNRRRSGLIFGNIALALGIVVVVLVIRVIALGTPNADKEKAAHKIAEESNGNTDRNTDCIADGDAEWCRSLDP